MPGRTRALAAPPGTSVCGALTAGARVCLLGGASQKRTCLHLAASCGESHIVEFLLKHDAIVNPLDRWGGTPLADAVREGHTGVATILRVAGAELEFDEAKTSGEMCDLAKRGDVVSLNVLLECGARVDAAECVPPAHGRAWHMATRGSLAPSPVS